MARGRKTIKTAAKTAARRKPAPKIKAKAKAKAKAARPAAAARARRAAGKLRLSILCGDYEIVRALKDGTVQPKGIELVGGDYPGTGAIHDRVAAGDACDINEYNGGHYVVQKAHGRADITAIPVFLHRRFRHGFIYINTQQAASRGRRILAGRRVACRTIGAAADYWMRGLSRGYRRAAPLHHLGDRAPRRGDRRGRPRS